MSNIFVTVAVFAVSFAVVVLSLENNLAKTPPMGWNSWNHFGCKTNCTAYPNDCISESLIMSIADAIVSSGLVQFGYEYVNLGACTDGLDGFY